MPSPYTIEALKIPDSAQAARAFCLGIIRDFYGIDYHREWHADLDSLTEAVGCGWYLPQYGGGFRVVRNESGSIIGTGGFYDLQRKPATAARLAGRYAGQNTCQIARVYLAPACRGKGLGSRIVAALEVEARSRGYRLAYLHADAQTSATLAFWERRGYRQFGRFSYPSPSGGMDTSVDFDKTL
ncbi:GNAT family N-acetyltransferase [Neorhizobium sp. NPDC001467]|uniref:GNAT family N-acetyltransferase n=1 Tax=Neorhizobium sp. NPDC001467 TaxID=3390595 RepID=UPI003D08CE36